MYIMSFQGSFDNISLTWQLLTCQETCVLENSQIPGTALPFQLPQRIEQCTAPLQKPVYQRWDTCHLSDDRVLEIPHAISMENSGEEQQDKEDEPR